VPEKKEIPANRNIKIDLVELNKLVFSDKPHVGEYKDPALREAHNQSR